MRHLVFALAIASLVGVALFAPVSGDSSLSPPPIVGQADPVAALKPRCDYSLSRIRAHRQATWKAQHLLQVPPIRLSSSRIIGCKYARWVEGLWWKRSIKWKKLERQRVLPDTHDWVTAVRIVQRVYPGTESWLLSCSAAEGGHGQWVWYGGRPWTGHHIGNDYLGMDTVGGQLQFRFSTFDPYSRWAFESTQRRGFVIPTWTGKYDAWLSPLGQALTGGYMRYFHRDGHHWSASSGNGC